MSSEFTDLLQQMVDDACETAHEIAMDIVKIQMLYGTGPEAFVKVYDAGMQRGKASQT